MSNIASLSTLFGMFAKFLRLLSDLGVAQEHYQNIVNDKMARQNLAEYLVNGCPAIMSGGSPLVYCGKGANPFAEDGLVVISGHHRDNGWVSMGDVNLREPAEDSRTGVLWHRELMDDSSIELANTCLMAHLLVFQNEIPPSWDGKLIFFWGTFYTGTGSDGHRIYVLCMAQDEQGTWHACRGFRFKETLPKNCYAVVINVKVIPAQQVDQVINCNIKPNIPDHWSIIRHKKGGMFKWNPEMVETFIPDKQKNSSIGHSRVLVDLKGRKALNGCVMDWLLDNPEFIPEAWKEKCVYFFGTIYSDVEGMHIVFGLYWDNDNGGWKVCRYFMGMPWGGKNQYIAVFAV